MLTTICAEIRNYFLAHKEQDIHGGQFVIENGVLQVDFLTDGQYYRVVGSALNDGVFQYGVDVLADEEFKGSVWAMSVPKAFVDLSDEIDSWVSNNASAINSPYTSESFAGYSYTKGTGTNGAGLSWQSQFATRLNAYRRISVL